MKPKINLNEGEKIIYEGQPKTSLVGYILLSRCLPAILFFSLALGLGILHNTAIFIGILLIVSVLYIIGCTMQVHKHWFFLTNQRCITYSGFLGINKKVVPYSRVVDVDMNRNILRGIFGFSAVYLAQQGLGQRSGLLNNYRGNSNLTLIDGITHELAEKISDLVSKHMTSQ